MNLRKILLYAIPAVIIGLFLAYFAFADSPNFWLLTANKIKPLSSSWDLLLGVHTSNPTEVDGSMYYNSVTKVFNCGINGSWQNCATATSSATGITTLNNQTGASQTFATTSSGSVFNISSSGNVHTFTFPSNLLSTTTAAATYVTQVTGSGNIASSGGLTPNITFTGVLPVANGGTATSTAPTQQGQLLGADSTGVKYAPITLINGANITITTSTVGQLTIAATGLQASGNYITALTGDVTASGPGSVAATLATVNSNTGTFGSATQVGQFTVNGKGLITSASNVSIALPASAITSGVLAVGVGGTGTTSLGNLTLTSSNLSFGSGDGKLVLVGTSTNITFAASPSFTNLIVSGLPTFQSATTSIFGVSYFWPSALPASNKILQSDSSGNLSWVTDQSGGGGSVSGGTTGFVATWASSTGLTTGILRDNGTVAGANATSSTVSFLVQGTGTLNPFQVNTSTGGTLFQITPAGIASTTNLTVSALGTCSNGLITSAGGVVACNGSAFLTGNQTITLTGDVTGSGATSIATTYATVVPVNKGGTGTSTVPTQQGQVLIADSTGAKYTPGIWVNGTNITITTSTVGQISIGLSGTIGVGNGGTGQTTLAAANILTSTTGVNGQLPYFTAATVLSSSAKLLFDGSNFGFNATSSTIGFNIQGTGGSNTILNVASSSGTSILAITSNSKIGIGTTTASGLLTLQGSSGFASDLFDIATSTGANIFSVASAPITSLTVGTSTAVQLGTLFIQGSTASTTLPFLTINNSSNATIFKIDSFGHKVTGGTAPTCDSGCTAASIVGDDSNMRVITSSTALSTLTVTFANTYTKTPVCFATEESAGSTVVDASSTPTTVVLTYSATLTSKSIAVHCEISSNFTQ